jgi:hypothetical protein
MQRANHLSEQQMKKAKMLMIALVAACAASAAIVGCHSQNSAQIDDRASFKGGPMPANVGQIIAQRAALSAARSVTHSTNGR